MVALAMLLAVSVTTGTARASADERVTSPARAGTDYPDGTFGQAAREWCTETRTFTPSRHVRTRIVRSTDGWSNTISSRYRKFKDCKARQMTSTVWCTTKKVDGFSEMCITPRPKAGGSSPCRSRKLDVRGVYHPRSGILRITCVNMR
jgi:hypothetical protein